MHGVESSILNVLEGEGFSLSRSYSEKTNMTILESFEGVE